MKQFYLPLVLFFSLLISQFSWSQVKVGDNPTQISPFTVFELESTDKGFLPPRLTTTQRNGIDKQTAPLGLMIYNLDRNEVQYLNEEISIDATGKRLVVRTWESATSGASLTRPDAPEAGELYFDPDTGSLEVWNGSQWLSVSLGATTSSPTLLIDGSMLTIVGGNTVDLSTIIGQSGPRGGSGATGPAGRPGPAGPTGGDNQILTLSGTTLSIQNGNSVDLTVFTNTDSQTITASLSGTILQLLPENTTVTETLDLAYFNNTGTDNQSITDLNFDTGTNSLTVGITNGASQTIDLSQLDQDIAELGFVSGTNTLTVGITNGASQTVSFDAFAQDITGSVFDSTTNSLTIAISNGASQTLSLATLGSTTVSGTLTLRSGTSSYTLPNLKGATDQVLTMLDASSGTTTWTTPEGLTFIVSGTTVLSRVGTATHDFIFGATQFDNIVGATDDARFFFDKSKGAFRAGYASGTTWNDVNIGVHSTALGYNTEASGNRSTALGNGTEALSYAETTLGSYSTNPTPSSKTAWITSDRLFVVGNGSSLGNRSDALVIQKSGATRLNGDLTVSGTVQITNLPIRVATDVLVVADISGNLRQLPITRAGTDTQTLSLTGDVLSISGTNSVSLDDFSQDITGSVFDSTTNSLNIAISNGASETISLATLGNTTVSGTLIVNTAIGIGINPNTASYTLDIVGDANITGEIYQTGTVTFTHPDYVFESYFDGISEFNTTYRLPSLEEVERFVRVNKHLPGVQSRADIQNSGSWNVSKNIQSNLEKVEELYLHTIEQQKQLDAKDAEIKALKERLAKIEAALGIE